MSPSRPSPALQEYLSALCVVADAPGGFCLMSRGLFAGINLRDLFVQYGAELSPELAVSSVLLPATKKKRKGEG